MPATIKQNLDAIKAAVYGEEVRTAIHDSIEQCYKDTTEGKTLAEDAADKANMAASNADTARRNAQAVVDGAVTAINDAAAQQRQSVNDLGDQLKDYLEDHYGETTDKVAAKANRSSVSTVKHAIGADGQLTLTDALNEPAKKMTIYLKPKQDLHGYDKPWVGGSGKNLCPKSVKAETAFGITIALKDNGTFLVTGQYDRNTTTEYYDSNNSFTLPAGEYILSGTPQNDLGYQLRVKSGSTTLLSGNGTFTLSSTATVLIALYVPYSSSGHALPASGLLFEPMIRLSTVTDPTYEPYSNICPIEGFDSVEVVSTGKNLCQLPDQSTSNIVNGFNLIPCKAGDIFYVYGDYTGSSSNVLYAAVWNSRTNNSKTKGKLQDLGTIQSGTVCNFIPTVDGYFGVYYNAGALTYTINKFMISRESFSIDEYEPFGQSLSLNLVSSAGSTVYGGTVTVNEDGSGTLIVNRGQHSYDGSQNWRVIEGSDRFYLDGLPSANLLNPSGSYAEEYKSNQAIYRNTPGSLVYGAYWCFGGSGVYINKLSPDDTIEALKARLGANPMQISFLLSTPATYNLTATQLQTFVGTSHIWTDGTGIELDYYADKYGLVDRLLAAFPKDTATGNPATFTDGADGIPVEKLEVAIEPKQDLHGYDNPWVGGAGKNLLPDSGYVPGVMDWNAQNADGIINNIHFITSPYIKISENEQYTISAFSGNIVRIYITDENYNTLYFLGNNPTAGSSRTIPKTAGARYIRISIGIDDQTVAPNDYGAIVYGQLETGSVASAYEPYSNTCPITGWDVSEIKITDENVLQFVGSTTSANGIIATKTYEGLLTVKGTATDTFDKYLDNYPIPAGHYILSGVAPITSSGVTTWYVYNTNTGKRITSSTNPNGMAVDVPEGQYARFGLIVGTGDKINVQCRPTLTKVVNTVDLPLKSISGSTVYGGKLVVNRDGTGELVIDRAKVNFAGIQWAVNGTYANTYNVTLTSPSYPRHAVTDAELMKSISNKYMWFNSGIVGDQDYGFAMSINNDLQFYIKDKTVATASDANAKFADLEICFPLHYPVTYQLTAPQITTILGTNHISCDAGEVTVTYHADPTLFITKKIAQALNA